MKTFQCKCPHCGHDELVGADTLIGLAYIESFSKNASGQIEANWEGTTEIQWDDQKPQDPERPFGCLGCQRLLTPNELVEIINENDQPGKTDPDSAGS